MPSGDDWNGPEIKAIVEAYFWMLGEQFAGRAFSKKDLVKWLGAGALRLRSKGAIERKLCNVSAAVVELGLPRLSGYKPLTHLQSNLLIEVRKVIVERALETESE